MTVLMDEAIVEKISNLNCWETSINRIEPLSGGMTNLNFKVTDGNQLFVVRLGEDDPIHLISRANEVAACLAAYEIGTSPELVHVEPGVLVVRFIEGKVLQESDITNSDNLVRIVDLLRRFHHDMQHTFSQIPVMFWVFQVLRHYQRLLRWSVSSHRSKLTELFRITEMLERSVGKIDVVFGHNDLLAANFIDDGEKIWLIDFDYAGFNSPLFDLSNLASNNQLSVEQEIMMLEAYFGRSFNVRQWRSYYAMKCASLLRETLWSMVSEIHSGLDIDFTAYTSTMMQRFEVAYDTFQQDYP